MRTLPALLLLCFTVALGGCFRYVPSERGMVPPGTEVRARLTDAGQADVRQYFGPDVNSVGGRLVRWDQGGLGLLVEMSVSRAGFPATTLTDTIDLLPEHLSGVDVKELDGKRTLGFTAGVMGLMAGALIAAQHFGGSSRDNGGEGEGPEPEAAVLVRIPILRVPFGIGFR